MNAWRLEEYAALASTSDTCIARAKAGEAAGLAVMAGQQTEGRGSRGRQWVSAPGNLALSVLLRPDIKAAESGVFALLAGIGVAEGLKEFLPGGVFMLKWPNDVLLGGAKLAGLLIDAAPVQDRIDWLVIGIGVNILHRPEIPGRSTTAMAEHGARVEAPAVGEAVLERLTHWLGILAEYGAVRIIQDWLSRAHPVGTLLEVKTQHRTVTGAFAGLSPAGELLLSVENRIEKFSTGEILLGTRE